MESDIILASPPPATHPPEDKESMQIEDIEDLDIDTVIATFPYLNIRLWKTYLN